MCLVIVYTPQLHACHLCNNRSPDRCSIVPEHFLPLSLDLPPLQEEDRARQLRVIEDEAASRLSNVIRAVSSGTPESDGRRKQEPCSSELQEALLCFRTQQLAGKEHSKCTDLVNALEVCTSSAPRQRQ